MKPPDFAFRCPRRLTRNTPFGGEAAYDEIIVAPPVLKKSLFCVYL
jgi:hypothetical protein